MKTTPKNAPDVKVSADNVQVGGAHYKGSDPAIQHWNVVIAHQMGYFEGQITRYLFRWRQKNGIEDLNKAQHYMNKLLEVAQAAEQGDISAQRFLDPRGEVWM